MYAATWVLFASRWVHNSVRLHVFWKLRGVYQTDILEYTAPLHTFRVVRVQCPIIWLPLVSLKLKSDSPISRQNHRYTMRVKVPRERIWFSRVLLNLVIWRVGKLTQTCSSPAVPLTWIYLAIPRLIYCDLLFYNYLLSR